MPKVKALEVERHLGEIAAAPVCVLAGADEALRARSLRMVLDATAPADQPGSTVRRFEEAPEARDVFDELRTVPFMGMPGRRVVVVEQGGEFMRANAERLTDYLQRPSSTGTLILCVGGGAAGKKGGQGKGLGKLSRAIGANGVTVDCSPIRWREAERWLRSAAQALGKKLTPRAVSALVEARGPNVLALQNELEKLAAFAGTSQTIAERDVREMVAQARSRRVFDLGGAVGRGDAGEALRLCERLLLQGERLGMIMAVLGRQVRQLWQIKRLRAAGSSEKQTAQKIGVPDFVVQRAARTAAALPEDWFARQFETLAAADFELKTKSVRANEEKVWLECLLARLCRGGVRG